MSVIAAPRSTRQASFLVCRPDHFDSHFLFNPWLDHTQRVDRALALRQWERLVETLEQAGARVEHLEPSPVSCALCFTADTAFCFAPGRALVLRNDGPRGVTEPPLVSASLQALGYEVEALPPGRRLDGGNLLCLDDGTVLAGIKPGGAAGPSERYLAGLLRFSGAPALVPVQLRDPMFVHLDMVVGALGGGRFLVHRDGLADGRLPDGAAVAEVVEVGREDALAYGPNTVVVGDVVVTGLVSDGLRRRLSRLGLEVERLDLGEFNKAGGGAKCLTLPLRPRERGEDSCTTRG